ncbi:type II toxin-antitoxin system HicB family antitoxin [Pleurocapsa sp. PCC 7319]|uniref:type II toxin-antitoxin system HicB family antitoxin n=1 Tax=Pleurocapsa sp. PCC 7319 TaxID=118161 RepID=UPI000347C721|nr:DUF1902 domain-containing protein [Pleurocapsa sp. PCC 7319]
MKAIVKLKIERFEEQQKEYFVATSDEIQGLVAEGKTVEEAVAIAEDLARILLELDRNSKSKETLSAMPKQFEYPLIIEV